MTTNGDDRGFALLIVAIALAALSLIFAAALGTARQHLATTAGAVVRVRLSAAADGGIATAERELVASGSRVPAVLLAPQIVEIGGLAVRVSARPEATKLDLNAADPEFLLRYFVVSGLDSGTAQALVEQISARRKDAGVSISRTRYENHLDHAFQTVSELGDLRGASRDLLDCVGPDLTVFTGVAFVDTSSASERVRRASGIPSRPAQPQGSGSAVTTGRAVVPGEIFEITAEAGTGGYKASKEAIIRATGNPRKPIWLLAQFAPAPNADTVEAACGRLGAHEQKS